jgi:hypothetical protein
MTDAYPPRAASCGVGDRVEWVPAWWRIGIPTHGRDGASRARLRAYPYPKEADVPSGVFPVPKFRSSARPAVGSRPGPVVRMWTRWTRNRLDDELARGADPAASAELRLRAAQLRSHAERFRLANAVVETVGEARGANLGAFTLNGRRQHAAIRESADDLTALAARLRDTRPVSVRGAAMTSRLVGDGASPLHRDGEQDLQQAIRAAMAALDATGPATQDLTKAA